MRHRISQKRAKEWMRLALQCSIDNGRSEYFDCGEVQLTQLVEECFWDLTKDDPKNAGELESEDPMFDWAFQVAHSMKLKMAP